MSDMFKREPRAVLAALNGSSHEDNGYKVTQTHRGQTRRYGGTMSEYKIESDKDAGEILEYCRSNVNRCDLSEDKWKEDQRLGGGAEAHFRNYYTLSKSKDGVYFYSVSFPSTH